MRLKTEFSKNEKRNILLSEKRIKPRRQKLKYGATKKAKLAKSKIENALGREADEQKEWQNVLAKNRPRETLKLQYIKKGTMKICLREKKECPSRPAAAVFQELHTAKGRPSTPGAWGGQRHYLRHQF